MINKGKNAIYTPQKNREVRKEKCTITTHENLSVKIDYISIVFETTTAEDVIMHILGLPTDIFNVYPATVKFKTYQTRWEIGDIYVSGDAKKTEDNPQGLGCYLVMTGKGCDDIYRILEDKGLTFGDMFGRCERRYGLDNFHFTRLDIAIDDKNEKPFFTIEQIKKKCEKEEFISNSEGCAMQGGCCPCHFCRLFCKAPSCHIFSCLSHFISHYGVACCSNSIYAHF